MEPTIEPTHNNALRIIIIVVFIILVAGVGGFLFYTYQSSQQANEQNAVDNTNTANISPGADQQAQNGNPNTAGNAGGPAVVQPTVLEEAPTIAPTEVPPFDETQAWLKIETADGSNTLAQGQEATITVTGFSENSNIDGYDILLSYDPDAIEVIEVESAIPAFNIQKFIRSTFVSVTGYKRPDVDEVTVFDNTPILTYTVMPKAAGETELSILPSKTVETTKFVDPDVNQIFPQPETITLQIE